MSEKSNPRYRQIAASIKKIIGVLIVIALAVTIYQVLRPVAVEWGLEVLGPTGSIVWAVALDPNDPNIVYAGTEGGGIYKSADGGKTWIQRNTGLESLEGQQEGIEHARDIRDILISRTQLGAIYVATWGADGIYRSDDGGDHWRGQSIEVSNTGDADESIPIVDSLHVRVLAETNMEILAGTDGGVFRLFDPRTGLWRPTGLTGADWNIRALLVHPRLPQTVYAASLGGGIYKSEDGGQTWQEKNDGLTSKEARKVNALIFDTKDEYVMYAGTFGDGVYRSIDGGESWEAWSEGLPGGADVWSLQFMAEGTLFAGLRYGGTYKRTKSGEWQQANFLNGALALEVDPTTGALYAGTWGKGIHRNGKGRDESRQDWQDLGLPTDYLRLRTAIFGGPGGSTLYVGTDSDGVYASQDGGRSWEPRSEGLEGRSLAVWSLAASAGGHTLYVGTGDGVSISADDGKQWRPLGKLSSKFAGDSSVVSLAISSSTPGGDIVYAGTRHGLWSFDSRQEVWSGPQDFSHRHRTDVITDVSVLALLVDGGSVYASVPGFGVYKSDPRRAWRPAEMSPKYVQALALADKAWLQWGGRQLYALTERGLYGSPNGITWNSLYPGSVGAITTDPQHPQVAYASLLTTTTTTEFSSTISATSGITATLSAAFISTEIETASPFATFGILVSTNDGRTWQDAGFVPERANHLVRDPIDPHRIFALVADGGLYQGEVYLPWLWREVVVLWLAGLILLGIAAVSYGYFNLLRDYGLSHRLAWGLVRHFPLILLGRSPFQRRLKSLERIILATVGQTSFRLVDVWERLDEIGISTSRSRLIQTLNDLSRYRLLREQNGDFRYVTPGLQAIAAVEFQESEDTLIEGMRRENRLLNDIERFFEAADFDVRQDAPQHLTEFVLRPHRFPYRDYGQIYAWLRLDGALKGEEVNAICEEAVQKYVSLAADVTSTQQPVPVAFVIVTQLPEVEAFRQMRTWREQVRLIPLSTTVIRAALRERSATRDLDLLVQQQRTQADLYDIRVPIIDRLDFYGRQEMINSLKKTLQSGRTVHLWSLPGMGKTSLLWHLKEALITPLAAYVDLTYGWSGESLFHEQIITDLTNDLRFKYNRFFNRKSRSFEEQLLSIAQAVPTRGERDIRIVLLLDGLSVAGSDSEQQRSVEHLRHLANTHPNLALVAAWEDAEPPVGRWEQVRTLNEAESEQLIATIGARMGLFFTQDSLATIYRETGGHPFLLRQLGSAVAQQSPVRPLSEVSQVTPEWVERDVSNYRTIRDHYFEDVWQWCSPDQKERLKARSTQGGEQQEDLLETSPYQQSLIQPDDILGNLFVSWILVAAKENRL